MKRILCMYINLKNSFVDITTNFLILILIYGSVWGLFEDAAVPGTPIFSVLLLMLFCEVGGRIAEFLKAPEIIGLIVMGFIYRNFVFLSYYEGIPIFWTTTLRNLALGIILIKAGLGLQSNLLRQMGRIFICALIPLLAEAVTVTLMSYYLLGISWLYAFCLGFILSGLSPAVVVPYMLNLENKGYGSGGVCAIVIAVAALDDTLAITGVGVCLGVIITKDVTNSLIKIPIEVVVGILYGVILGYVFWFIPRSTHKHKTLYRNILISMGGLGIHLISIAVDSAAAGALGSLTLSFICGLHWRKDPYSHTHVVEFLNYVWVPLRVFLFGSIGAELTTEDLQRSVIFSLFIIIIGVTVRFGVSYGVLYNSSYHWKEKIFMCITWIPKATVQATMGSLVLYYSQQENLGGKSVQAGTAILTVSVMAIVVTAPIGAMAIEMFGTVLLRKHREIQIDDIRADSIGSTEKLENEDEEEYPFLKDISTQVDLSIGPSQTSLLVSEKNSSPTNLN